MSQNSNDSKNRSNLLINSGSKLSNTKKSYSGMKDVSKTTSCSSTLATDSKPEINITNNLCTSMKKFDNERQKDCAERKKMDLTAKEKCLKYGTSLYNKSVYNKAPSNQLSRKKSLPASNNFTNTSAQVVLFERNVEIKDLESKVKYLQNKIKKLEGENKTLQNVQSQHEKELRKFKEGIAEIPSLLKSHRQEVKVFESTITNIKKELSESQKEIKSKNEIILKKDNKIDKLTTSLRKNEKIVNDLLHELRELRSARGNLEKEKEIILRGNEELKNENVYLHKKVEELLCSVEHLKNNLNNEMNLSKQLKADIDELQEKYQAEKLKVSFGHQIGDSRTLVISDLAPDDSNNASFQNSTGNNYKHENKYLKNLLLDNQHEKINNCDKSVKQSKCDLVDTFTCSQTLCNMTKSNSDIRIPSKNNLNILPPLNPHENVSEITVHESKVRKNVSLPTDVNLKNNGKETELDCSESTQFPSNLTIKEVKPIVADPFKRNLKFHVNDGYSNVNNEIRTNFSESEKFSRDMKLSRHQKKKEKTYFDDNFKNYLFNKEGLGLHLSELKTGVNEVKQIDKQTAFKYSVKKKCDIEASSKTISKKKNENMSQKFQYF